MYICNLSNENFNNFSQRAWARAAWGTKSIVGLFFNFTNVTMKGPNKWFNCKKYLRLWHNYRCYIFFFTDKNNCKIELKIFCSINFMSGYVIIRSFNLTESQAIWQKVCARLCLPDAFYASYYVVYTGINSIILYTLRDYSIYLLGQFFIGKLLRILR